MRARLRGKLQHGHFRAARPHGGALNRIVVDENKAIEAKVQLRGEGAKIGGL